MKIIDSFQRVNRAGKPQKITICAVRSHGQQRYAITWGDDHKITFSALESCYAYALGRGWGVSLDRYRNIAHRLARSGADGFDFDNLDLSISDPETN